MSVVACCLACQRELPVPDYSCSGEIVRCPACTASEMALWASGVFAKVTGSQIKLAPPDSIRCGRQEEYRLSLSSEDKSCGGWDKVHSGLICLLFAVFLWLPLLAESSLQALPLFGIQPNWLDIYLKQSRYFGLAAALGGCCAAIGYFQCLHYPAQQVGRRLAAVGLVTSLLGITSFGILYNAHPSSRTSELQIVLGCSFLLSLLVWENVFVWFMNEIAITLGERAILVRSVWLVSLYLLLLAMWFSWLVVEAVVYRSVIFMQGGRIILWMKVEGVLGLARLAIAIQHVFVLLAACRAIIEHQSHRITVHEKISTTR